MHITDFLPGLWLKQWASRCLLPLPTPSYATGLRGEYRLRADAVSLVPIGPSIVLHSTSRTRAMFRVGIAGPFCSCVVSYKHYVTGRRTSFRSGRCRNGVRWSGIVPHSVSVAVCGVIALGLSPFLSTSSAVMSRGGCRSRSQCQPLSSIPSWVRWDRDRAFMRTLLLQCCIAA